MVNTSFRLNAANKAFFCCSVKLRKGLIKYRGQNFFEYSFRNNIHVKISFAKKHQEKPLGPGNLEEGKRTKYIAAGRMGQASETRPISIRFDAMIMPFD